MSRQSELAQIHIAKKDLGMEDDAYRTMLRAVAGVESSSDLDFQGRHAVIHRMKELGWKPKRKKHYGPKAHKPRQSTGKKSQGDKIRALWIAMKAEGVIETDSEAALRAYVKRMTKGRYEAPQLCDDITASRIIESLKSWRKRVLEEV